MESFGDGVSFVHHAIASSIFQQSWMIFASLHFVVVEGFGMVRDFLGSLEIGILYPLFSFNFLLVVLI